MYGPDQTRPQNRRLAESMDKWNNVETRLTGSLVSKGNAVYLAIIDLVMNNVGVRINWRHYS